jgi:predicted site-specific integrase-resolvase
MSDPTDKLLKPKDVAAALSLNPETLYRWMRNGVVQFVWVGPKDAKRRRKRIHASELARLVDERPSP